MKSLHILIASAAASLAFASPAMAEHHEKAADHSAHSGHAALHDALTKVLADPRRDKDRARDQWRHPMETLAFFQVTPDMTVAEYAPGGGWYTRVLAPLLAEKGKYVAVSFNPESSAFAEDRKATLRGFPTAFLPKIAEAGGNPATSAAYNLGSVPAEAEGTVDRVLLIRMMHNLYRWNIADSELKGMRSLLKPGGMLGVVQHRAPASATSAYADGNNGYMRQDDVIKFIEAQGFEFVGSSEVNANPKDSADHDGGVWNLPPAERSQTPEEKAKYGAIGESDRMTLLFRKRD